MKTSLPALSVLIIVFVAAGVGSRFSRIAAAQSPLPELTAPVNDFAHVVDQRSAEGIDRLSRALKAASGDVVVVATTPDINGYGDIREYANKLFENHGKGIGERGRDNGLLIVLAMNERAVWIEVGYELEQWITDGFAGETSRVVMAPLFRTGEYGAGLLAGVSRIVGRIAQGRNVTLPEGVVQETPARDEAPTPLTVMLLVFFAILIISRLGRRRNDVRRWGRGPWSGWSSGVGPFGGGWGGGFGGGGFSGGGGGGFGGGFGGFGGGR